MIQESFALTDVPQIVNQRWMFFSLWITASLLLFWRPVSALIPFSMANDNASHVVLIPLISAWMLFQERKRIFQHFSSDYLLGGLLLLGSFFAGVWTIRFAASLKESDALSGSVLSLILIWVAGFVLIFGRETLKNARFPLLFLFLTIPLPEFLLNRVIYSLQQGSASIAEIIFDLAGVPALRDGFVFHLARFNIEVARECSGIRSSIALLILALLVGHLLLRAFWRQAVFVICGLLVMVVKNGVRIATLTILAQYVDPGFLYGKLHHQGGVVFFLLGLLLLLPILWLLQRGENPPSAAIPRASAA
jgi:exosortase